jgi:hypothetical protein
VLDEDNMASNSATQLATQQSIKAYVDSQVGANNELSEILANGNTTGGTNIVFGDSASVSDDRLVFGAGSDLQIYHSGVHSYIDDAGTGNLTLRGNASVRVEKYEGEILADFAADGAVSLYHDNSVKIATTSTGVNVTGNVAVSGTVDGRDVATDGTKLDGIEAGATADQTAAEIRTLVEAATDSNVFTDADHSKLDGIEALADVTDTTNVTAAGALMDSELTNITAVKALDQGVATTDTPTFAGLATTADVSFGDNDKAVFGAGSDLQIYHDGTNSFISDVGTGNLILRGSSVVALQGANGENGVIVTENGAVDLRYDNSTKLDTTSTGIDVTGTVVSDGVTVDGNILLNNEGNELQFNTSSTPVNKIYSDDTYTANGLTISADNGVALKSTNNYLLLDDTGTNEMVLNVDSGERLRVTSTGIDVTGTVVSDGLTTDGTSSLGGLVTITGTAPRIELYETDTTNINGRIDSSGGDLNIKTIADDGGTQQTRIKVDHSTGDISFYEDTGTTPKFFWDASTERLGIGTTSPSVPLDVIGTATVGNGTYGIKLTYSAGNTSGIIDTADSADNLEFRIANTQRMKIDSSGIDVTGTAVTDGLTVDTAIATSTASFRATTNSITIGQKIGSLDFFNGTTNAAGTLEVRRASGGNAYSDMALMASANGNRSNQLLLSTNGDISFYEDTGTTAKFFWDASAERLGIGTTSPTAAIHATTATAGYTAKFINTNGASDANGLLIQAGTVGSEYALNVANTAGTTNFMVVKGDGKVGIGTNIPAQMLELSANNGLSGVANVLRFNDSDVGVTAAQPTGRIEFAENDGGNTTVSAFLEVETVSTSGGGEMTFGTGAAGVTATERMRLDASGNLLVDCTTLPSASVQGTGISDYQTYSSATSTSSRKHKLFFNGNGEVGSISTDGSATAFNTSSDQRLKDNIVDAPSASDDIDAIQVRSFDWKADGSHQKYGMVAQELQSVAPEAVSGDADSDDMMGVDYSKLVPMMLKEIQSLRARVAQLEGEA